MVITQRFLVSIPVLLRHAAGAEVLIIRSNSSSVYVGANNTVSPLSGFRLSSDPIEIPLKNNDEVWAMASSTSVVSILVST
jgi:hypothetical protein